MYRSVSYGCLSAGVVSLGLAVEFATAMFMAADWMADYFTFFFSSSTSTIYMRA